MYANALIAIICFIVNDIKLINNALKKIKYGFK